jgi:short-subunit dehydrogenase
MMRKQGYGRIINVSSVLGLISMPFRGAYNASKYAVEGLSDTLRLELHQFGIDVITIQPGPIDSKFRDNVVENSLKNINISNSYYKKQYEWMKNSFQGKKETSGFTKGTDAVIVKMVHAIESKRPHLKYPVTLPTYLFIFLKRFVTTRLLDRLLRIISRKELS